MPRITRKKIKFTEESINELMQEIYNDNMNIRSNIIRIRNTWERKIKDPGEIIAMGKSIIDLINAEMKNNDQKLMLMKHIMTAVSDTKNGKKNGENSDVDEVKREITPERRNELYGVIEEYKKSLKR